MPRTRLGRAVEIAGDVAPAATDRDRRAGAPTRSESRPRPNTDIAIAIEQAFYISLDMYITGLVRGSDTIRRARSIAGPCDEVNGLPPAPTRTARSVATARELFRHRHPAERL